MSMLQMKNSVIIGFLISIFISVGLYAGDSAMAPCIIPAPAEMKPLDGRFLLTSETQVICSGQQAEVCQIGEFLVKQLNTPTGYNLKVTTAQSPASKENSILIQLNQQPIEQLAKEGYRLYVRQKEIVIEANTPAGLFYGVQSLLQLLPVEIMSGAVVNGVEWTIPCVEITDAPRFGWRGLLLDVSRHFFTKAEVMAFIDQMARYKLNTFHWHLTDDQGWRIEIKQLPKLTEVGAWRVPRQGYWWSFDPPQPDEKPTCGGFYTQDDIREIVAYAQSRFITIVPEIDVPGHSMAALASYPDLSCGGGPFQVNPGSAFYGKIENNFCAGNEDVYRFLDTVFGELAELFPGDYIHMGGDEAFKEFWAKCPKCQKLKKDNNLKDEHELQSYFVKRVEKILQAKGKKLIGWDEILEGGLAPNATVMSWRGTDGGIKAAQMGHAVVMTPSPFYYLDLYQGDPVIEPRTYGLSRLNTCYAFEPVPAGIDPKLILGVQGNLWAEEISEFRQVQYMAWPRGFAVAETGWSPEKNKDWKSFAGRVEHEFKCLDQADIKYARCMYDVIFNPKLDADGKLLIELDTEIDGLDIFYTFEGPYPDNHYPRYENPLQVPLNAVDLRVITYRDNRPIGKMISISIKELQNRAKK